MKNLNLKQINLLFTLIIYFGFGVLAQTKSVFRVGISVNPALNRAFLTANDSLAANFLKVNESNFTFQSSVGSTIWFRYLIKPKLDIMFGLGYSNLGFQRKQENLKFNDPTYPGIGVGKIEDLSNTEKSLYYNYRFDYINIPVLLNWYIGSDKDYKFHFAYTFGAQANLLINHSLIARTNAGYNIDGKNKFSLDSSGFTGKAINLGLLAGVRMEYNYNKKVDVFAQPLIFTSPMSLTKTPYNAIPLKLLVNIGLTYAIKE
jgi:hypothetical protein